jgi:hypothetical protein
MSSLEGSGRDRLLCAFRGGGLGNLESKQMLDQTIEMGRGGVFLSLTPEQYAELLHSR